MNDLSLVCLSMLFSIFSGTLMGKLILKFLKSLKLYQPIRTCGPEGHLETKKNTPSMGGLIILSAFILSMLVFVKYDQYVLTIFFTTILYAVIGAWDDLKKIYFRNHFGVPAKVRFVVECLLALPAALFFAAKNNYTVYLPFSIEVHLSYFYIFFAGLVIVSVVNAVNLTDGLDGLVSFPLIIALGCFAIFSYTEHELNITVLSSCFIGAIVAFLWFNSHPAKIFMGDMGSLGCGAFLACVALASKKEIMLIPICFLFIIEVLSVIIQVSVYKKTKKRFFLMAPIHHHFERKGMHEVTIVKRFWIVSFIFALFSIIIWNYGY